VTDYSLSFNEDGETRKVNGQYVKEWRTSGDDRTEKALKNLKLTMRAFDESGFTFLPLISRNLLEVSFFPRLVYLKFSGSRIEININGRVYNVGKLKNWFINLCNSQMQFLPVVTENAVIYKFELAKKTCL